MITVLIYLIYVSDDMLKPYEKVENEAIIRICFIYLRSD